MTMSLIKNEEDFLENENSLEVFLLKHNEIIHSIP